MVFRNNPGIGSEVGFAVTGRQLRSDAWGGMKFDISAKGIRRGGDVRLSFGVMGRCWVRG